MTDEDEMKQDIEYAKQQAKAAASAAWSYLAWGASKVKEKSDESGLSEKMAAARDAAKLKAAEAKELAMQKAEEYKVAEKAAYAGEKMKTAA